ncbi:MAG: rod shape-determining protein RodA [Bacillota bacterium]
MERRLLKNLDFVLIAVTLAIMIFGLVAIRSATAPSLSFVKRQLVFMAVGWVAAGFVVSSDYTGWARYSSLLYVVNLIMLLAVRLVGHEALGAQRWIKVGSFQFQPSELAKIIVIITLATSLSRRERIVGWGDLLGAMAHILPPLVLVLIQPDLGTSLVFVAILVGMLFMAGAPVKKMLLLFGGGVAAAVSVVGAQLAFHLKDFPLKDYQLKRLIVLVNPEADPTGAGYHVLQSKIAIGSGGALGKGLFFGTQTQLSFLPERHTDFIFSVVGEELGFVGAVALLLLFLILLVRAVRVAGEAKDLYGTLLATGVTSMIAFHLIINIGMTMGIMPVTGIPLPFVSYSGSSLLTNTMGIGILLNVYMRRQKILF